MLGNKMKIHELVIEMKMLERRLTLYEEKYGILSEDFYAALMKGQLERYDAYDETLYPDLMQNTLRVLHEKIDSYNYF